MLFAIQKQKEVNLRNPVSLVPRPGNEAILISPAKQNFQQCRRSVDAYIFQPLFPLPSPSLPLSPYNIYMIMEGCPRRSGIESLVHLDLRQLVSTCIYTTYVASIMVE